MTIKAVREAKANLRILPVTGMTKPGDFDHYTRVRCCRAVTRHYPPDFFVLNLLPLSMRLAGPKEALLHTIIAKNYGCTHFVVGRDHVSPETDAIGRPFYESRTAQELTKEYSADIGVTIVSFEDEYRSSDQISEDEQYISFSSSGIRERIRSGCRIPEWATFKEVVTVLKKAYPSPNEQGFTIFLTGLSGSRKIDHCKSALCTLSGNGRSTGFFAGWRYCTSKSIE